MEDQVGADDAVSNERYTESHFSDDGSSGSLRPLQLCDSEFQFPGVMYVCDVVHLRGQRYCLDGQVECTESSESSGSSL